VPVTCDRDGPKNRRQLTYQAEAKAHGTISDLGITAEDSTQSQ